MAAARELSNEEAIPESKLEMPVLQEMINDIRESTASNAQNSNSSLLAEDLLITHAIALSSLPVNNALSAEGTGSTDNDNNSTDKNSEDLVEGLTSTSKRFSITLNNAASQEPPESEENFSNTISIQQTAVQSSVQAPIPINQPKKKQHIMISYNRSCEDDCRKIRNSLKALKYKVWMDVFDMHDNFIDGMANAIRNSYIVLICINREYDNSYWCKKELQDIAIKKIKCIPCFMEERVDLVGWLEFLVNGNVWINFFNDEYDNSFKKLVDEITAVEKLLATNPRETPPTTPIITIITNPTAEESFDMIIRNFKTWVEDNRDNLKRMNRKQSSQLINQLIQGLQSDNTTPEDQYKKELLQQLLSSTSQNQNQLIPQLFGNLNESNYPLIKSLLFIIALWAVRVVFKKD